MAAATQLWGANPALPDGELRLWFAMFALAIVGLLALYVSSKKIDKLRKEQEAHRKRSEAMERRFDELFGHVGENIYRLSKEMVETTHDVRRELRHPEAEKKIEKVLHTETKILNSTSTLLNFLKLKARKVTIRREPYNINRVLDDVVGNLIASIRRSDDVELIFHIDKKLPKNLLGDFGHTVEILSGLLENAMLHTAEDVVTLHAAGGEDQLYFQIAYRCAPERSEIPEKYFDPLFDESSGEYTRLNCFNAYELIQLFGGDVAVEISGEITRLSIRLPVTEPEDRDARKYRLSSLEATRKKVFIVNRNRSASEAIAQMFRYFRHEVDVWDLTEFERKRPPLVHYDIFVVEEPLVDTLLTGFLDKLRAHRDLKVVSVRNIFAPSTPHFDEKSVDKRMTKPLTLESVYRLIEEFYGVDSERNDAQASPEKTESSSREKPEDHREFWADIPDKEGIGITDLNAFGESTVLIVEDNEINRKMLLKVLQQSGLKLLTAEHGEAALEVLRSEQGPTIDLVLMDINMPVMDGYTATREIRKMSGYSDLPIVALSALSIQNEKEKMRQSGMDGFLPKPLHLGQLYSVFRRYLTYTPGNVSGTTPPVSYPDEIDMREALAHTNNNEWLLRDILKEFQELYADAPHRLSQAIRDGDDDRAAALLLDLKGLSGAIGARRFYRTVTALDNSLRTGRREDLSETLADLSDAHTALMRSLERYRISTRG